MGEAAWKQEAGDRRRKEDEQKGHRDDIIAVAYSKVDAFDSFSRISSMQTSSSLLALIVM